MSLKWWLIAWGILTFVAAVPGMVMLGLIFFILPGLVLLAAPTVFGYSAAFALIRRFLRLQGSPTLQGIAVVLTLMLGWAIPQPWRMMEKRAFERANLPEVVPAAPIELAGNIALEMPRSIFSEHANTRTKQQESCNALCAALLDTPGVKSVSIVAEGVSYRLMPRGDDRTRGAVPTKPELILEHLPEEHGGSRRTSPVADHAKRQRSKEMVAAAWGVRLASSEKLVREEDPVRPDMTIRVRAEHGRPREHLSLSRVEILDGNGKPLLRRSIVTSSALAAPLRVGPVGLWDTSFRLGLDRERLSSGPEYPALQPVTELFLHSSLARPKRSSRAIAAALERLRSATANATLTSDDPDFALAGIWIPTIDWRVDLPTEQVQVLSAVIADERIPLPKELFDQKRAAPEWRGALGSRIVNPATPEEVRRSLARLLWQMPRGTFKVLSADEQAIVARQELRVQAYPLIVRLADQGEAAIPELLSILKEDRALPWHKSNWVMQAVCLAFATLGPTAHPALPELDTLLDAADRREFMNSSHDRDRWYLALARMGKPMEEFKWFNRGPEADRRDRERLLKRVAQFDAERVWEY